MAVALEEPYIMQITRTPEKTNNAAKHDDFIDYRKLPRSSGDGMEHSGNNSEQSTQSSNPKPSQTFHKTIGINKPCSLKSNTTSKQHQNVLLNSAVKDMSQVQDLLTKNAKPVHLVTGEAENNESRLNEERDGRMGFSQELFPSQIHRESKPEVDYTSGNSTLCHSEKHLDQGIGDFKDFIDEHANLDPTRTVSYEEFSRLQDVIRDTEDRYTKIVEDKTKLCVQLGLQSEVNAELKKLVVAAVGEDLENSLEALLMRNAQSAVELKHWKTLSEEYAEESDKLAIECDVWRTKFMASRMMSDELSSWKTTLYTRFKQTQSALQRILNEREELKKYLIKTKWILRTLNDNVDQVSSYNIEMESHHQSQQSVLELASLTSCLVQDLATKTLCDFQGNAVAMETFNVTEAEKHTIEPTPGERLARQVLTSEVELQIEKQLEDSSVMKRLGKQYIGNSCHSRLMTNSFRVTYDCCDRCKGPVQVI